jgi:hypothetical protein
VRFFIDKMAVVQDSIQILMYSLANNHSAKSPYSSVTAPEVFNGSYQPACNHSLSSAAVGLLDNRSAGPSVKMLNVQCFNFFSLIT